MSFRAPNRSQRLDTSIDYETRPGDTTYDTTFSVSQDGRRKTTRAVNVGVGSKRQKLSPSDLADNLGNWIPLREGGAEEDSYNDPSADDAETGEKRKRYESSDDTLKGWRPYAQRFLDELVRREALLIQGSKCLCCEKSWTADSRRFRCEDCGEFIQCFSCTLIRHTITPLHRIQEWKGNFWTATSLSTMGGVYQLGHGGHSCPRLAPVERTMVVLDTHYIHTVKYRYCGCDHSDDSQNLEQLMRNGWYPATVVDPATCATFAALDLFRLLNVVGNINARDFVTTLERRTNATHVHELPDRYKAFGRMSREYAWLKRLLHAGRAHNPLGLQNTKNGECAVLCWACPHDNINLPEGWREVSPEFRFLYMLLLAMDANFRLKNRLRANAHDDPPLGGGWGYMVEERAYKKHLKGYVAEKDVSTCIAFTALVQKDARLTTGLRCSGVGGVVCARHELVRPQGVGDLQKGERYANMDYILLSAVLGITLLYLTISYDIACQWRINFQARMGEMPRRLHLDLDKVTVLFGLPVWHALAHEKKCQVRNSLSYVPGVGRTDGEGIERTWSLFNPLAWATKEMNAGARHDAIEDKMDHHNFEKNINHGTTLQRKLILALTERDTHVEAFKQIDSTLKSELRKEWQEMIDEWLEDNTKPNPYELPEGSSGGSSEAAIRLALTKDEAQEAAGGGATLQGSSVTSFLTAGLQLEEAQRRIRREIKGRTLLVSDQTERVEEIRVAFFSKLSKFRNLQAVYMPAAVRKLEAAEDARDSELPPPRAEDVKLWLPSELPVEVREDGCRAGLPAMEGRLREGQCRDALVKLRSSLHTKRYLLTWRDSGGVAGQRAATRAFTLIGRVGERVDVAAVKYRGAREALVRLRGRARCDAWRELKATDIDLDDEREVDTNARRRLGLIGSKRSRRVAAAGSSRKTVSWIWTADGGPGDDEKELHDSVRVEWAKAKARKERWEEEVELLREEMRRVLRFLRWRSLWWETRRGTRREQVSQELRAGLEAYAARQAAGARAIARKFKATWDKSAATAETLLVEGMAAFGLAEAAAVECIEDGDNAAADAGGEEGDGDDMSDTA
ncbi:hypothetical protein C8F04DRAFT_1207359 [Mycena alexandri]|uniref:CxC2-like cysteine cluster KDZ transposase-associated domain-containing protein n=1 Tax=Mycena alexandri TaxID=1745969 RepID=A0AAD6TE49_9AGAR|nr:hypothetical protein C8F04DRAFT_1207359 [Mycena alexandri]